MLLKLFVDGTLHSPINHSRANTFPFLSKSTKTIVISISTAAHCYQHHHSSPTVIMHHLRYLHRPTKRYRKCQNIHIHVSVPQSTLFTTATLMICTLHSTACHKHKNVPYNDSVATSF